jgi:glycopeptide antibiotics resistance protein
MEFLQIYLPRRVPSNLDLVLNAAGTWLGALLAALLERWGAIDRWSCSGAAGLCRMRAERWC